MGFTPRCRASKVWSSEGKSAMLHFLKGPVLEHITEWMQGEIKSWKISGFKPMTFQYLGWKVDALTAVFKCCQSWVDKARSSYLFP